MVAEIHHAGSAALARPFARSAYLSNPACALEDVARFGVPRDRIDKGGAVGLIPNIIGLSHEALGFNNSQADRPYHFS